jgi:hypothetical protein
MFLDDIRDVDDVFDKDDGEWTICRSFKEAQFTILEKGMPYMVAFDYVLSASPGNEFPELTGYDVAQMITHMDSQAQWTLPEGNTRKQYPLPVDFSFTVHSSDPQFSEIIRTFMNEYLQKKLKKANGL